MQWFEYVAAVFVLLTGLYLTWYWYHDLRQQYDDAVVAGAVGWQESVTRAIQAHQTEVVTVAAVVVVAAVGLSLWRRTRTDGLDHT